MNKEPYQTLAERITELETEYNQLIRSNTSTLKEMQRIDEIEQSIPYVREWKWELVRERLIEPEGSEIKPRVTVNATNKLNRYTTL